MAPLGTAIIFGFLSGPPEGSFSEVLVKHFGKSIAVRVSDIYTHFTGSRAVFTQDMETVFTLLEQAVLQPQLDEIIPLRDASKAHRKLEAVEVTGKLVLTI